MSTTANENAKANENAEKVKPGADQRVKHPVRLSEGRILNISDFVNMFLEYVLFFRWIYFKNRPRGNLLFIRSLIVVTFFSAIFYRFFSNFHLVLEGIEIDPVIALGGGVVFGYWSMISAFYKKSETCSKLYTEMLKAWGDQKAYTAMLLSNSMAIHLLTMDMWAHRSYGDVFAINLTSAIRHRFSKEKFFEQNPGKTEEDRLKLWKQTVAKINSGQIQAKEARILLEEYQLSLLDESRKVVSKAA